MGWYDTALICENGHIINQEFDERPEDNNDFCSKCGARAISKCTSCNTSIKGYYHGEIIDALIPEPSRPMDDIPAYCHNCGKPYPWTEKRIRAINELLEMSGLDADEIKDFNVNLADIITDTPRTKVAALKIKKVGAKLGKEIWEVAKPILAAIGSAAAKQVLGL